MEVHTCVQNVSGSAAGRTPGKKCPRKNSSRLNGVRDFSPNPAAALSPPQASPAVLTANRRSHPHEAESSKMEKMSLKPTTSILTSFMPFGRLHSLTHLLEKQIEKQRTHTGWAPFFISSYYFWQQKTASWQFFVSTESFY